MSKAIQAVKQFLVAEDGPTAVEYAVMLALIIVVCVVAITALGTKVSATFAGAEAQLPSPPAAPAS